MRSEEAIDRVTPTRRPTGFSVMRQDWHHLLFLHWIIPAGQLRPLLPPSLELDTFEGNAYVGLVPFTMTGVRPICTPAIPSLSNFHETNVRTYVHRDGRDPGVWFFSLDAANAIAVRAARILWKLPYFYAHMRLTKGPGVRGQGSEKAGSRAEGEKGRKGEEETEEQSKIQNRQSDMTFDYATERCWPPPVPATCTVCYTPQGLMSPAAVGTLDHFLVERYILYAFKAGQLYCGQVHHQPYPLQTATVHALDECLISAAGIQRPDEPPLIHYAREVNVEIFPLHKI